MKKFPKWLENKQSISFFFLLETFPPIIFISIFLWKKSLRPLSDCSYLLAVVQSSVAGLQPSEGSCWLGQGALLCSQFKVVCNLGLNSSTFGSGSSPFTQKFLLGHSLFISGLNSLFRISVDVKMRYELDCGPATRSQACAELSWPVSTTSDPLSELPRYFIVRGDNVHLVQRSSCVTQGNFR